MDEPSVGPRTGDAFGAALVDRYESGTDARPLFIERDDGLVHLLDADVFISGRSAWSEPEGVIVERAGRRVLDVGAGGGRHALPLQAAGHEVVALDVSPGALEVCRRRGVRRSFQGTVFDLEEGGFDTFLLAGNNLGLLESADHAPRFLRRLADLAAPGAEILGTGVDPFATDDPLHLAYHDRNRARGRLPGQLRLRTRWADLADPWFGYLFVPVEELERLARAAGWELVETRSGPVPYLAVLRLVG